MPGSPWKAYRRRATRPPGETTSWKDTPRGATWSSGGTTRCPSKSARHLDADRLERDHDEHRAPGFRSESLETLLARRRPHPVAQLPGVPTAPRRTSGRSTSSCSASPPRRRRRARSAGPGRPTSGPSGPRVTYSRTLSSSPRCSGNDRGVVRGRVVLHARRHSPRRWSPRRPRGRGGRRCSSGPPAQKKRRSSAGAYRLRSTVTSASPGSPMVAPSTGCPSTVSLKVMPSLVIPAGWSEVRV